MEGQSKNPVPIGLLGYWVFANPACSLVLTMLIYTLKDFSFKALFNHIICFSFYLSAKMLRAKTQKFWSLGGFLLKEEAKFWGTHSS